MCYVAPVIAAVATAIAWRRTKNVKVWWLTLMFFGGGLCGVIDHLWNGEVFSLPANLLSDLLLGLAIVLVMLIFWSIALISSKANPALVHYLKARS